MADENPEQLPRGEPLPTVALAVTLRPAVDGAGRTQLIGTAETQAASSLPRIPVSLGEFGARSTALTSDVDLQILGQLGEGGMGRVLLARQHSLQREVAIKTSKLNASKPVQDQLIHEGVVTGRLEHPGIVPIHALALDQSGRPVVVMKRISGVEWRELIHRVDHPAWASWLATPEPSPTWDDRLLVHLEVLMRVCEAVHFAHSHGIIHRDIKPENVMLGRFGEVYLVDWGIAVILEEMNHGGLAGTPGYMAPEMALGGQLDARTDVYLLGATLHEVLTGEMRHTGRYLAEVIEACARSEPYAYSELVPTELAQIASRATHKDPAARFPNAEALRVALRDYLRHRSSLGLSREALRNLNQAEALLGSPHAQVNSDPGGEHGAQPARGAPELLAIARFGFEQALEIWADNAQARAGQVSCLIALVELELQGRDARRARAWLGELAEPSAELTARVAALEAELEAEAARSAELERLAADLDESVSGRQRFSGLLLVGISGTALSAGVLYLASQGAVLTAPQSVGISIGLLSMVGIWIAIMRRDLLRNAYNRRLIATLVALLLAMLVNRLFGWQRGNPIEQTLVTDQITLALGGAVAAIAIERRLAWMLLPVLLGLVGLAVFPEATSVVFSISVALATLSAAWLTRPSQVSRSERAALPDGVDGR